VFRAAISDSTSTSTREAPPQSPAVKLRSASSGYLPRGQILMCVPGGSSFQWRTGDSS
jgi:hypothetical protein